MTSADQVNSVKRQTERETRFQRWMRIEGLFVRLFETLEPVVAADVLESARDFVEHREYGLALDDVSAFYFDAKIEPSPEALGLLVRLAIEMGIDPSLLTQEGPLS